MSHCYSGILYDLQISYDSPLHQIMTLDRLLYLLVKCLYFFNFIIHLILFISIFAEQSRNLNWEMLYIFYSLQIYLLVPTVISVCA